MLAPNKQYHLVRTHQRLRTRRLCDIGESTDGEPNMEGAQSVKYSQTEVGFPSRVGTNSMKITLLYGLCFVLPKQTPSYPMWFATQLTAAFHQND